MANNVFSLEVLPAKEGDCLLLRYGSKTRKKQKLALIDGGPSQVYEDHLQDRLTQLRTEKSVPAEEAMMLDWVMVSHVDEDHTTGIIQLTEELKSQPVNRFVKPARLWHNSFDDLLNNDAKEVMKAISPEFVTASLSGGVSPDDLPQGAAVDTATLEDVLMVLAGISDGIKLRDNAKVLEIPVNDGKKGLVVARKGGQAFEVGDGLSFRVIGPMLEEVKKLQQKHDKFLEDQKKRRKTRGEALAAYADPSVHNLSSIVVLAEFRGKKILFTGDARGDKILAGMKLVGIGDTLHVDVLKGLHHGSENNVTQDFFERVTADHYVFSGDGKHGNPERETLDMLRLARPGATYDIYLTYEIPDIDKLRKADWEKKQRDRVARGNDPGPNWSAPKQSLAAFFKKHPDMKERVVPLQGDVPRHRIDLLAAP